MQSSYGILLMGVEADVCLDAASSELKIGLEAEQRAPCPALSVSADCAENLQHRHIRHAKGAVHWTALQMRLGQWQSRYFMPSD